MKKQKILALIFSLFFFFFFVVFSYIVKDDVLNQFDFDTTVRIQNHIPKNFDVYLSIFSLLGSFEITFLILIFLLIFNRKILGIATLFNFVGAHIIEIFGKGFLEHPGPPFMFFRYDIPFLFPSSYVQTGSSYPSGHSLRIVFLATILFFLILKSKKLNLKGKVILNLFNFAFAFLMLLTRVSLGEHWMTDVVGGSLLGMASGFFSLIFL